MLLGEMVGNIARLRDSIESTARRAGRPPAEIKFILVTKTVAPQTIEEAFLAGVTDFGENRVQELLSKKKLLPSSLNWHMIGHLQTNKVRQVLGEVVLLHSLDRPELGREVEKQAALKKIPEVPCLLQINLGGKSGFLPEAAADFAAGLKPGSPVRIKGLMTIGPLTEKEEEVRQAFRRAALLQSKFKKEMPRHDWSVLSMGMSGDYKIAIEEGATLLRIGTAVFGSRLK